MRAPRPLLHRDRLALGLPLVVLAGACTLPTSGTVESSAVFSGGGSSAAGVGVTSGAGGAPTTTDTTGSTSSFATSGSDTSSATSGVGGASTTAGEGGATSATTATTTTSTTGSTTASTTATTTATTSTSSGGIDCDTGSSCQDCGACAAKAGGPCATEAAACAPGSECDALYVCLQACNDNPGCQQQCAASHDAGVAPLGALANCFGCTCPNNCPTLDCN